MMTVMIYNLISILDYLIYLYSILMVVDAIISWIPGLHESAVARILSRLIDPYVNLFRKGPIESLSNTTGIDISFLVGVLVLYFIQSYVINWLLNILLKLFG